LPALAAAGKSDKLEVSTRAIGVLSRFLQANDAQTELAAETALEEIASGRVSSSASHAESALAGYRGSRQERAIAKLRQLGAEANSITLSSGEIAPVRIAIGEGWRGTADDLASLKRISSLQALSIYVKTGDEAVKHIAPLRSLGTLELYGTGISDEGVKQIAAALPAARIDRRKGGMLGVAGLPGVVGGGCLVNGVQAGSAAERAGLQPGDVITHFEGKAVDDFDSLTKLISEKSGGDTIKVDIRRDNETLKKEVKLGQWKNSTTFRGASEAQIIIEGR
jgi:membrane-associated protease RseP (regulator of RpoE activity)